MPSADLASFPLVYFSRSTLTVNRLRRLLYVRTALVKAPTMSVTIIGPLGGGGVQLPFYSFKVPAGFPSPAADHLEQHISIDELLDI